MHTLPPILGSVMPWVTPIFVQVSGGRMSSAGTAVISFCGTAIRCIPINCGMTKSVEITGRVALATQRCAAYSVGMSYSDKGNGVCVTSVVAAVIEDSAGRVLLCQQNGGHRLWGLPGGKIRAAESPIHAAIRDIREETGTETKILDVVGMYQVTGDGCGEDMPDLLVYVFRGRLEAGEAAVNSPGRIRRLAWCDPAALPQPLTATTRIAIADALADRSGVLRKVVRDAEPEVPDAADDSALPSQPVAAAI